MLTLLLVSVFSVAVSFHLATVNDSSHASNIDWWPMFQHDLNHTGTSTSNVPATNNTLWSFQARDTVLSPVVVDNLVYVSSTDGTFYCLNAGTGGLVWKYVISAVPIMGYDDMPNAPSDIPAVAGGIVFVGSEEGQFYALNATTGAHIWDVRMGSLITSSATVVGNLVYLGCHGVYCLNAATGAFVWQNTAPAVVVSSPAVVAGLLYVGGPVGEGGLADDGIYCLNATDGSLVWNYVISTSEGTQTTEYNVVECSPTVVDGLVYMGSYDGNVYCLDAVSGALIWKYWTGGIVYNSLAVANGLVYVASENQTGIGYEPGNSSLYCLNATTGNPVWKRNFGSPSIVSSPAMAGGIVFVGVGWGNTGIYGLNATTGAIVWSHKGDGLGASPPVVANGLLYAGAGDGISALGGSRTVFLPYLFLSLFLIALLVILLVLFIPRRKSKTETSERGA